MKILLVDDHFVVREGLAALLRGLLPDVEVNEAGDGEEALQAVQREIPSLVIVDLGLPGISGLELTRRLRQRLPQLRVLFFSLHDELALVRQALDAGARGYVTKRAAPTVLLEAIRRVLAGQLYLEQPLATRLACQSWEEQGGAALRGLTRREFEIFRLLARGLALREVRRVLKPGGVAIFVDVAAPGQALPDTFLQTVELLRDTSHVRNYSPAEWARLSGEAGLLVTGSRRQRLRLEFQSWVERMRTPEVFRQAIRSLQLAVGEEVREYFEIADDGSFSTDVLVLWLRRE
nr:response regulator transcription factor [Pseudomonas aeruginosa]